ncbi:MAG: class I SAM-dependent methyltransferase [Proteobacteria bacterium]|nr:class I SAM-dependent methyltransferase [Pseudomonadota bacterium]
MSTTDRFYSENAETYVASGRLRDNPWRTRFISLLAAEASVLELGCGGGYDTQALLNAGLVVTPTDGIAEMAAQARARLGIAVSILRFSEIDFESRFDGIYASACLLHVPRTDLPGILARIHRALKPSGLFYASFKAGLGDGCDGLGRYYNYPDEGWLKTIYEGAGWREIDVAEVDGTGYDRQPARWLHVYARA